MTNKFTDTLRNLKEFHVDFINSNKNQYEIFSRINDNFDNFFLLESLSGPQEMSEMSVIGFDPKFIIKCDYNNFYILDNKNKILKKYKVSEPINQLKNILPKIENYNYRYLGGAVGYISYEAISFWEKLPSIKKQILNFPLMEFGIFTDGLLYDHIENQAYYFYLGDNSRLKELEDLLDSSDKDLKSTNNKDNTNKNYCSIPKRNITMKQFMNNVKKAQKYIYDGDIFQVVLSKNLKFNIKGNLFYLYSLLREINPSPYMYLFKMGDRSIIGSSPEMLLRVSNNVIETFPIAGTRPIVKNEKINKKMEKDLLNDEKELAEHTMLVDLARNDVGKVSKPGTVRVNDLMKIKRFSHVQHIVSHVTGILDKKYDSFDSLKAVFPAGTVSGAPKIRAMEIINELEDERREAYAGALGYFSFNGSCDFAITIRSIFINKNKGFVQTGAGIVMDSVPKNEWLETERKADAMITVLNKFGNKK
ncbi:MAG: anthranilate synthase component I family protein [Nitrososphaeraceae archaeon]